MNIVFFGTPHFVQPVLAILKKNFNVIKVVDKNNNLTASNVAAAIEQLSNLTPDLFVIAAYGALLPKRVLDIPKYGALNVHPSLLPKYRGPSPIQAAILNGDKISGITIIKMDEEMDHGPILFSKKVPITTGDSLETLSTKMFQEGANILPSVIMDYTAGKIKPRPQNETKASYCKLIKKEDGYFEIHNPPSFVQLDRMIRAYYPWPGVWTRLHLGFGGQAKLKIVKLLPENRIQMEGGKPMSYKDFVNGYPEAKPLLGQLFGKE